MGNLAFESGHVKAGESKLHYLKMGSGPKLLIAFHGYSNDASLFSPFEKSLSHLYTIYSIDLPFHGKSEYDHTALTKQDLVQMVNILCKEMKVSKASLAGYSMGGRLCIAITELMPKKIERVVLLASDGLVFNPFYYFLTNTWVGKHFFTNVLTKPQRYIRIVDWLNDRKWIQSHQHSFALHYLQSEHSRTLLLKVWPCLRKIIPIPRKVRAAIENHNIPVYVFMGAYDKVIPSKLAHSFKRNLKNVHLYILNKGHRIMDHDTLPQISACLL